MKRWLAVLSATGLLGGCSTITGWFSSSDTTEPPAPLVDFQPSTTVRTLWTHDAGASGKDRSLTLRAAVRGNRVAVADPKGRVTLLEADTGTSIWEVDTRVPASAGPTLGDALVVVGASDGQVVALEAESGTVRWQTRVSSEILSPPAIGRGVVVVRSLDGRLFGLDAQSGRRLWVYEKGVPLLSLRGTGAPTVAGELALNGFDGGRLVAIALRDGRAVWEARVGAPRGRSDLERMVDIDSAPVVLGDAVYVVSYHGQVAALELTSGRPAWQRDMSSSAGLAVDGRNVYVSDDQSHVWALDRFNGRPVWHQERLQARGLTAPVVLDRYVVVGDREGYLHWLRREDGEFAARQQVDKAGFYAAPEVDRNTVYAYSRSGVVEALRPVD